MSCHHETQVWTACGHTKDTLTRVLQFSACDSYMRLAPKKRLLSRNQHAPLRTCGRRDDFLKVPAPALQPRPSPRPNPSPLTTQWPSFGPRLHPHLRPHPRPTLLSSALGHAQSFATDYATGPGERPHELVARFRLERRHVFHRLFQPAHCLSHSFSGPLASVLELDCYLLTGVVVPDSDLVLDPLRERLCALYAQLELYLALPVDQPGVQEFLALSNAPVDTVMRYS